MHQRIVREIRQFYSGDAKHSWCKRHVMVEFSPQVRESVANRLAEGLLELHKKTDVVQAVFRSFLEEPLLGIVCAPKTQLPPKFIQLGISFPFRRDGVRVRSAIAACDTEIVAVHSPQDAARHLSPAQFAGAEDLLALVALGRDYEVEVGLFGSAALQAITGLAYFEPGSDIDAVVSANSIDSLKEFHRALAVFAKKTGRRIDAEVTCAGGRGVKLEELMSNVSKVLSRGMDGVCLIDRQKVLKEIEGEITFELQKH